MPASKARSRIAWLVRSSAIEPKVMVPRQISETTSPLWPSRRLRTSAPREHRRAALDEGAHSFLRVLRLRDQRDRECLVVERRFEIDLERAVEEPLRHAEGERRTLRQPRRPLARRGGELLARHHLVHQPDTHRFFGG